MSDIKDFFKSRMFLKHVLLSVVAFVVIIWFIFQMLSVYTRNGDYVTVPDLSKSSMEQANIILEDLDLNYEVVDSVKYNSKFPKYYILYQDPEPGKYVKKGRTIRVKINPSDYRKVKLPNIVQTTKRSAETTLLISGLKVGKIKYIRNIAKDLVLYVEYKGNRIKRGDLIPQESSVDLVCGSGMTQ